FFNIGSRFLIPALAPLALALALALASRAVLLPVVALLHAFLSWYSTPIRYFDSYAPRITSFPVRAALGLELEEAYLARRNSGYLVDRLIEREVPTGEKVFSFDQIPEAWTTRRILVGYYSAENESLADIFTTAMAPTQCPRRALDLSFPPQPLRRLRAVYTGPSDPRMWEISEFRMFSGSAPIQPDRSWRFNADPNPWDARLAFDNSLVTRWRSWGAAAFGMFLAVDFSEPTRLERVQLSTTAEALQSRIELQGMDAEGRWRALSVQRSTSLIPVTENLRATAVRALLDRDIRYLLVSPGAFGANEFAGNAADWGMQE